MRGTSFLLPDDLHKRLNIAAASMSLSSSEYIRAALTAALKTHAEHDPMLAAAFAFLDERERTSERELVPA